MCVTFFLALALWPYVAGMQNGSIILIFGEEMNVKGNVCWAYIIEKLNYCVFTTNRITLHDETNFPTIEILKKKFIDV